MADELVIDGAGRVVPRDELSGRLAEHAGAWRLCTVGPSLLVALKHSKQGGLSAELPQLQDAVPALAGDLAEIPPSDLLSLLHQGRRTGILLASSNGVERCTVLIEGQVTWVASSSPAERLMVQKEDASTDDLWKQLDEKAIEVVYGLLAAESGTFTFFRAAAETRLPAVFALDTQAVLLDGLRRLDEMRLYRTRIPVGMRPKRVQNSGPVGPDLPPKALKLLELVDGVRTVAQLAAEAGLSEFAATRALYHFVVSGHVASP